MPTDFKSPRGKYFAQRNRARQRGIAWEFDFDSWWALWQQSGKWDLRGNRRGGFVMARHGDAGPYSPSNVQIIAHEKNMSDANLGFGRGWKISPSNKAKPYLVTCAHKHVGFFATEEEASAAYQGALAQLRAERGA